MENSIELIKSRLSKLDDLKEDSEFVVNAKRDIEYLLKENESLKDEFKIIGKLYEEYVNTRKLSAILFVCDVSEILSRVGLVNEQT